ncbi:hypothetical protein ScalyP_jg11078 [Parmales sp. scaly parma]|nr:hypothetical protein ScalyP_jg11078 [Parmales sp. scaly parma]
MRSELCFIVLVCQNLLLTNASMIEKFTNTPEHDLRSSQFTLSIKPTWISRFLSSSPFPSIPSIPESLIIEFHARNSSSSSSQSSSGSSSSSSNIYGVVSSPSTPLPNGSWSFSPPSDVPPPLGGPLLLTLPDPTSPSTHFLELRGIFLPNRYGVSPRITKGVVTRRNRSKLDFAPVVATFVGQGVGETDTFTGAYVNRGEATGSCRE